jgi:hypothetical protein
MRQNSPTGFNTLGLPKAIRQKFPSTEAFMNFCFPNGAILSCACGCGYSKEKTAEEMEKYLTGWPKMHGFPANVRPK